MFLRKIIFPNIFQSDFHINFLGGKVDFLETFISQFLLNWIRMKIHIPLEQQGEAKITLGETPGTFEEMKNGEKAGKYKSCNPSKI